MKLTRDIRKSNSTGDVAFNLELTKKKVSPLENPRDWRGVKVLNRRVVGLEWNRADDFEGENDLDVETLSDLTKLEVRKERSKP